MREEWLAQLRTRLQLTSESSSDAVQGASGAQVEARDEASAERSSQCAHESSTVVDSSGTVLAPLKTARRRATLAQSTTEWRAKLGHG